MGLAPDGWRAANNLGQLLLRMAEENEQQHLTRAVTDGADIAATTHTTVHVEGDRRPSQRGRRSPRRGSLSRRYATTTTSSSTAFCTADRTSTGTVHHRVFSADAWMSAVNPRAAMTD